MGVWEGILLLDTASVIAFVEEARRPDLLQTLARRAVGLEIPDTVLHELEDPSVRMTVEAFEEVAFFEAATLESYRDFFDRYPELGPGELGVIARGVALQSLGHACTCVLDDAAARTIAERQGLNCTGTIGLLLRLEREGTIGRREHLEILFALKAEGFRYNWENHPLDF